MTTDSTKPPTTAMELVRRYDAGEQVFRGVKLVGADLERANLSGAILVDATFTDANLVDANLSGVKLVGADLERANLSGAILVDATFTDANLKRANLSGAILERTNLFSANLSNANLSNANLSNATLFDAILTNATLFGAELARANLERAILINTNLERANLSGANLECANLERANLSGANLTGVRLGYTALDRTLLVDVDLTPLCEAHLMTRHHGPSIVDYSTILRSIRAPHLKGFLARVGVPEVFVEYMVDCARSLRDDIFKMLQSTFISYGQPDEAFARKLYEALHRNGVTTFFFPEHAVPGEKLHRMMRTKVNEYDRILLVCSTASLVRNGVLNEIEETLARETRDGGSAYLIPITLDDYVFTGWTPPNADTAQAVRDRVVADFRSADTDHAKFQSALLKLIGALKK